MAGRSLEKVKSALSEIEAAGVKGSLSAIQLDVTDGTSIAQAAKHVEEEHGRLDVLVNNAAIGSIDPDIKTRMQLSMDTNVVGPAVVAEAFRPLLFKAQKPYSIFVSSGVGSMGRAVAQAQAGSSYKPIDNEEAYRSSKAALNMIALLEANKYGPKGLKVFAMCPGFVVSNLRGKDEYSRNGWGGGAGSPEVSGKTLLSIIQGERDADVGKFVHKDGVYPW